MWYHAITDFGDRKRYWWNRTRDDLVNDLLVPMIAKQVKSVKRRGKKSLFNFGSVSYMTVLKTEEKLKRPEEGKVPPELKKKEFVNKHNVTEEVVNEVKILSSSSLSRSVLEQALSEPLKQIFVIMKFGDRHLDSAYEGVIKPLGEEFGFDVLRVDEIQDSGNISQQILENISKSELILAELSGERPNCYYEAGFAHALGKEMIFAISEDYKIHFDLAGHRFIEWGTEAELRTQLRGRLESYTSKEAD
jgi:hypothetical protein